MIPGRHSPGSRQTSLAVGPRLGWMLVIVAAVLLPVVAWGAHVSAQGTETACHAGLVVGSGESCTYPGTTAEFSVDSSGRGIFLSISSGSSFTFKDTTINGVVYNFVAKSQRDGTWLIETAGDSVAPPPTPTATATPTPTPTPTPSADGPDEVPGTPANQRYGYDGSAIVLSWDASADADTYTVYYDDFFDSSCRLGSGGPSFCEELATGLTAARYTHADPDRDDNYYWVVACNSAGCSEIDSANPAAPSGTRPGTPANQRYEYDGSSIVLSWEASADADTYTVYHDDFFDSSCRLSSGSPSFCEELATDLGGTSYTHTSPDGDDNYYWVVACNSAGCSEIDSANPVQLGGAPPAAPANQRYEYDGAAIVLRWDASAGADTYTAYHDDFFDSSCRLSSGSPSFCEELATGLTAASYTHASPDRDKNFYWLVACNSFGCSEIDSTNPVQPGGSPPPAPANQRYEYDGSAIVLSWDASAGADSYTVYYDDFFGSACRLGSSGPSFCEELATGLTAASYTHASPDRDKNFYWLVACNSFGCSEIDSTNPVQPGGSPPPAPANQRYEYDGSAIVLSWDASAGADSYTVYYDDFFGSACRLGSSGPSFCEELATGLTAASYTHASPDRDKNFYWLVACNSFGCSEIDSTNPVQPGGSPPPAPANQRYEYDGSAIVLSWDASAGADSYTVYYDDFFGSACRLGSSGPSFCEELATGLTAASYTHASPDRDKNFYWLVACNSFGCSEIDSTNPVQPGGSPPPAPANQRYEYDGSAIVLSWDASAGADSYTVYYDDFFGSACRLGSSGPSFCEELATGLTAASYTHASPDRDKNFYWLVACNSFGCSEIDSTNPVQPGGSPPPAPANQRYEYDGSAIVLSWDASAGADSYTVYYDDFFGSACRLGSSGPSFCEELATGLTAASYTHASPDRDKNFYWLVACNSFGCSEIDSTNPVQPGGSPPPAPANQRYEYDGSAIVLSWDASAGADSYTVYYDDFFGSACRLGSSGPSFCEELATGLTAASYTHASPDRDKNFYWLVACNSFGCSRIESSTPAELVGSAPTTPSPAQVTTPDGEANGSSPANPAPDLVVGTPTVSSATPRAGAPFSLSATVRNQGAGSASSTILRYYRSSGPTITTADTAVGSEAVPGLSTSQSADESVSLTAPATPGTYYYGSCVAAVSGEADTTNNCSSAVTVMVAAASVPDLVVDAPTVSSASPPAGSSFTLDATVRNEGNGSSTPTTLRFYRSSGPTITSADVAVGSKPVPALGASQSADGSVSLTAPATPGTYYYGACVDAARGEADTTNNCSSAVTVTAGAAPAPGLVVDPPTVSELAPAAGASFTLSATVRNQGNGASSATTVRYYRSGDPAITTSDTAVGADPVSALDASQSAHRSVSLTAPDTAGTYYYGACVDAVSGEADTTNNCSSAVTVTVGAAPAPDPVVGIPAVSTATPDAGAAFTLSATVHNRGNGASGSTRLQFYRSSDSTITSSDSGVGSDAVPGLSASESAGGELSLTAPSTPGTYYYGACVDAVSGESDTTNNCSSAVTVTVGAPPAPDPVVSTPTVSSATPHAGAPLTLSATVRNQGKGDADSATTLRYYRSSDPTISSADTAVGSDPVPALGASESADGSVSLTAPSTPGTYYYGPVRTWYPASWTRPTTALPRSP